MPLPFYLSCLAILAFSWIAWKGRYFGWGLPMLMALGTVAVWYIGDIFYNDYDAYLEILGSSSLSSAWWQVLIFVISFGLLVNPIHSLVNNNLIVRRSQAMIFVKSNRLRQREVQRKIDVLSKGILGAWLILMAIALVQVKGNAIGLFAPYLGEKANPWGRGQIGGGFSAFVALASYLQIFLTSAFGVLAALAMNPRTRNMALIVCALALPFYIFDRTRNTMLATIMPGLLTFVFLRLRGGIIKKSSVLLGVFILISFWFTVVMQNRQGMAFDISGALNSSKKSISKTRHEGLNMLEELAWINHFFENGTYSPNNGGRYFAELVNPIPRGLWKNKPTIGLDYALARGQSITNAQGATTATISTGMIGQGVVNFGKVGGPLAAAVLMAIWVAILARQDLKGSDPARLILYGIGLMLTFNMGRDITLLVLYPFIFGYLLLTIWNRYIKPRRQSLLRRHQKNIQRLS
ncbi:oligosaccharide repeat unit polymerase [Akkermansiaceae bacterium]|nr:oligosaccharide repeat unit polymerase [Akkermansiaceae bacterium]